MKNAAKSLKLNILAVVMAILGVGVPLGIYGITCIPSLNADPFPYVYLMFALAFLLLLIGFVIPDIQNARWRHKNSNYDGKLPEEVVNKAWSIRYPFFLAFAIIFTVCLFFEIWFWVSGNYPLPVNI